MPPITTRDQIRARPAVEARFWSRVDQSAGPGGCWEWTGCTARNGYGQVRVTGTDGAQRTYSAHRLAFILSNGQAPEPDHVIRHTCCNRICCNPAHLIPGTARDNAQDRERDGHGGRGGARGEANGSSALTEEQVMQARAMPWHRGLDTELGRQWGVRKRTINYARTGRTWRHLPMSAPASAPPRIG